jgi:ABC-type multidrug transport system ATPase subunit
MLDLLAGIKAKQRTIVLTTHQRELAEPLADSVITLVAGGVSTVVNKTQSATVKAQA